MQDDVRDRLLSCPRADGESLVSQMLKIQECQIVHPSFDYWKQFTCLSVEDNLLTSTASKELENVLYRSKPLIADGDFVAISYRWLTSCQNGSYQIAAGYGWKPKLSKAPDIVIERVMKYVIHFGLSAFWIDQECIDQQDSCAKERAIQSMDLVYRCSKYPLGILTKPLRKRIQLKLLHQMLLNQFVVIDNSRPQLAYWVRLWKVRKLLSLLVYLMKDPWWKRRWIFQEEYCSSGKMQLLIPNLTGLMQYELQETLGGVPGEVLIKAAEFRKAVTLFCLACSTSIFRTGTDWERCMYVLREAKTYRLLQKYEWTVHDDSLGRAMSTRILGDISRRAGEKPEDALAIMANCCGYPVRLDGRKLTATSTSLSAAMIALLLLNGELLWNDQRTFAAGNAFNLLKELSFNEFDPPVDEKKLTFMKQCRLVNVRFTEDGMKTTGHLWRMHKEIQTKHLQLKYCQHADNRNEICLRRLAAELETSYPELAHNLYQCQHETIPKQWDRYGLREIYKQMVSVLSEALSRGRKLIIARLVDNPQNCAIFVSQPRLRSPSSCVFTAYESPEYSELVKKHRSALKFVSLSVSTRTIIDQGLPKLQTRGWLNGLSFPNNISPTDVIFLWPAAMETLTTS